MGHLALVPGAGVGGEDLCSIFQRTALQVCNRQLTGPGTGSVDAELCLDLGCGVPRCLAASLAACQGPSQQLD